MRISTTVFASLAAAGLGSTAASAQADLYQPLFFSSQSADRERAVQLNNQGAVITTSGTPDSFEYQRSNRVYVLEEVASEPGNFVYRSLLGEAEYGRIADLYGVTPQGNPPDDARNRIAFRGLSDFSSDGVLRVAAALEGPRLGDDRAPDVGFFNSAVTIELRAVGGVDDRVQAGRSFGGDKVTFFDPDPVSGESTFSELRLPVARVNAAGDGVSTQTRTDFFTRPGESFNSSESSFTASPTADRAGVSRSGFGGEESAQAINNSGSFTGMTLRPFEETVGDGRESDAYFYDRPADALLRLPDPFGSSQMEGLDLNEAGIVVGVARGFRGESRPFLYNGFNTVDLAAGESFTRGEAVAVNATGMAVGTLDGEGVLFSAGSVTRLDTLVDGSFGEIVGVVDINDLGQVLVEVEQNAQRSFVTLTPPAALQPGGSSLTALLGRSTAFGSFVVENAPSGAWIDPPVAGGYEYTLASDTVFTELLALAPGFSGLNLTVFNPDNPLAGEYTLDGTFGEGDDDADSFDFTQLASAAFLLGLSPEDAAALGALLVADGTVTGVAGFRLQGLDPAVDPTNPAAFPLQLAFSAVTTDLNILAIDLTDDGDGGFRFEGPNVPEPAAALLLVPGVLLLRSRRSAEASGSSASTRIRR